MKAFFTTRDQNIAKVNMAMNYLSRLVRENLVLFDYDASLQKASFLTQSNKLVECEIITNGDNVLIESITVKDADEEVSDEVVDKKVDDILSQFIESLRENSYSQAENTFESLLESFENRSKINEVRAKLNKKIECFNETLDIINSSEYQKLVEIKDKLVDYLKENKNILFDYEDISNSIKLCNALNTAFNLPRKTWDELEKENSIEVPYTDKKTVFEMVCSQELIRHELSESKENFSKSWIKNEKISNLASTIFANEDEKILEALEEAILDVPYLALASKSDIKNTLLSVYESTNIENIPQKTLREFVAKIFEFKKPYKKEIIKELNESYGINVQNLKFVPTFSNLSKAQSVLFEILGRVGDKTSVVKDVCESFSKLLRKRGGVQALDVNDFIFGIFEEAGINLKGEMFKEVNLTSVVENIIEAKDMKKHLKGELKKKLKKKLGKDEKDDSEEYEDEETEDERDYDKDDEEEKEESDKDITDKKKKKKKKLEKIDLSDKEPEEMRYDENLEPSEDTADIDEDDASEETLKGGLDEDEINSLVDELESLLTDLDWDKIAKEEAELDAELGIPSNADEEPYEE